MTLTARPPAAAAPALPDAGPAPLVEPVEQTGGERRLAGFMRALALLSLACVVALVAADLAYLIGLVEGPPAFPYLTNTLGWFALTLACAALAWRDPRRFRPLALVVAGAHALLAACLVGMAVANGTAGEVSPLGILALPLAAVVWGGAAYGVLVAVAALALHRGARPADARERPAEERAKLTAPEWVLRVVLALVALNFAAFIVLYVVDGLRGDLEIGFVANSVAKDGVFLALTAMALAAVRRWAPLALVVAAGLLVLIAGNLLLAPRVPAGGPVAVGGGEPPGLTLLLVWVGSDVVLIAALVAAFWFAQRARRRLGYLNPLAFRALESLAEVLVPKVDELPPEQVARNVDRYMTRFRGEGRGRIALALSALYLFPLATRLVPLTALAAPERRDWLHHRFTRDVNRRPRPLAELLKVIRSMVRAGQQMAYVGHYGDPRGYAGTGFRPFSERDAAADQIGRIDRNRPGVTAKRPWEIASETIAADVAIVGSGAAGAILAYRLAQAGRRVTIIEQGRHVPPSAMNEDEMEMFAALYSDGALQLSRDFDFQVLQGQCVGGSTTVNNGVSFDLPPALAERWEARGVVDRGRLERSFAEVRALLRIGSSAAATHATRGALKFRDGLAALGPAALGQGYRLDVVETNIAECLGCGYCNSGCAYGKKLSMLDSTLLWAQREFPNRLDILSECRAERIEHSGGRARAVRCRLSDGRRVRVGADTVIVAAGAIASSRLLQRSRIGGPSVGRGLAFNMGSALTAEFPGEPLNSWEGLQMSHYLRPGRTNGSEPGFLLESWFTPVASRALSMPGWFEQHADNMRRLPWMASAGVVVGTEPNGEARRRPFSPADFAYTPTRGDLEKLVKGLELLARAYLEAGASRVMPQTYRWVEIRSQDEIAELRRVIDDPSDISLGSAHPQGGNALSLRPEDGVVDPSFHVHGFENLVVCDASVFPEAITVNPQLTVMALANDAAGGLTGAAFDPAPTPLGAPPL